MEYGKLPPSRSETQQEKRMRSVSFIRALSRGFRRRCPNCGTGGAFSGYLKVTDACSHCGEELGHIRADDAPPYFTILIVGHVIVSMVLVMERSWPQPVGITIAVFVTATLVMMGALLPVIKGAVVAVMWRLNLRGDEFQ